MNIIYLWLFYGIPSFFLEVFLLFWLRKPEFTYSFYRVLQYDMTINIFCYLNTWTSRLYHAETTLPLMVWVYYNFHFLFEIYYCFVIYFYHAQSLSVIIMSMHRLWSSKSSNGKEFWNKYYGHAYVLLLVVSGLLTIPNVVWQFNKPDVYDPVKKMFMVDPIEPSLAVFSNQIFMTKSITFFTSILIINISTVYLIRKRVVPNSTSPKVRTMMKNLTTIVFIHTTMFLIVLAWPIVLSFFFNNPHNPAITIFLSLPENLRYNGVMTTSDVFWKKYWRHAYGLLVLVSGLLTIPNSVWGFNKIDIYDPEKNKFVKDPLEPSIAILAINIFMAKSLIFFVLIFIFNISTVYLIWKRVAHNSASPKIRTMMRNLSTIVFIHTTMYLIVLAWPITLSIFLSTMPEDLKYNAVMTTSDVFWNKYWGHAYVLLVVVSGLLTIPNLVWGFNKPDVYDPVKETFVVDPLEPLSLSLPYILLACDRNVQASLHKYFGTISINIDVKKRQNGSEMNRRKTVITAH
ncbi:hypothetical protein CAEBREN_12843 [Caenorhabditis brenneri]|uniref:Serpentine receptor class gamma n=1 Tax=Caenorhabditis brenneri TaxID=135651 RepID=G0MA40_CAEBE|nr:hypothetical protein CAEBREN_12843 [Caenorhabditis brenneri]